MKVSFSYGANNRKLAERQNINIRVYHSSFDFRRSTGLDITKKDWDFKKNTLVDASTGARTPEDRKYLISLHTKLSEIDTLFKSEFLKLKLSYQLKSLTNASWNSWCDSVLKASFAELDNSESVPLLRDKFKEYMDLNRDQWQKNTIKGYESNLKVIINFEDTEKYKYRTDEVDLDWYYSLKKWNESNGNNENYFGSIIQKVKAVINYFRSVDKDFPFHVNIDHRNFKTIKTKPDHAILNEAEIELIYNYKGKKHLENVRDLFIIQYHACLRYDELRSELSKGVENLEIYQETETGKYYWTILEGKTSKHTKAKKKVPVHLRILTLYRSGNFPHLIQAQPYNKYIKVLMNELNIHKEEKITSHTPRRSFITNMSNAGYRDVDIQQYSGHSDIRTMKDNYIKRKNVNRENQIPTE
jgi:integrase